MAEEKTIVTKKTAPKASETLKKTVTRKTAAKPPTSEPPAAASSAVSASQAPSKSGPVTKPASIRKAPATGAAATVTPSATTTPTRARKTTTKPTEAPASPLPAAVKTQTTRQSSRLQTLANTSDEERLHMIQEAAYYRAEKRDFAPGHEVEDWAEAEREIDELIANAKRISGR
jgi:hypothetical protein